MAFQEWGYPLDQQVTAMRRTIAVLLLTLTTFVQAVAQAPAEQASAPRSPSEASEQWSDDGLRKVQLRGLDVVFMRPEASLAGYDKVSLGAVSVSFRRGWERSTRIGTHSRIHPADVQRIRERLATVVREEVLKQLGEGGYQVVDAAAEDVLAVSASIINLSVAAPDVPSASGSEVYSVSAGEMTLVAELRDSLTGDLIVRAYDHTKARESMRPHRIWRSENEEEARNAARSWAQVLRQQLDAAHAALPTPAQQ